MGSSHHRAVLIDKEHLVGGGENGKPVADDDDNGRAMSVPYVRDDLLFRLSVHRSEWIVQDDERRMAVQGSRKADPCCLASGKSDPCRTDNRLGAIPHIGEVGKETHVFEGRRDVPSDPKGDILLYGVGEQFALMSLVGDGDSLLVSCQGGEFPSSKGDGPFIRIQSLKGDAEGALAGCDGSCDADDLSSLGLEGDMGDGRFCVLRIGEGEILYDKSLCHVQTVVDGDILFLIGFQIGLDPCE